MSSDRFDPQAGKQSVLRASCSPGARRCATSDVLLLVCARRGALKRLVPRSHLTTVSQSVTYVVDSAGLRSQ